MKTRLILDRYTYGLDMLMLLNFSGTMLLVAYYNPSVEGAAAIFSLACFNIAGILIIRRKEMVREIEAECEAARQGEGV